MRRSRRSAPLPKAALGAATVAVALGLAACGEGGAERSSAFEEAGGVGPVRAGSTAQFASCRDWRRGSEAQRYATIEDIRGQLTPQSSETAESAYPDEAAYEMFEKVCATSYSDGFRLYKLYARAQAFAPLNKNLPD